MNVGVSRILSRFASVFGKEITPEMIVEYDLVLGDYPAAFLTAACDELIGECQWFPKPSEILAVVRRLQTESSTAPAEPDHWRRNTYQCQICRDTGYVTVWHPTSLRSAIELVQGRITRQQLQLYECAAKCTCSIGQGKPGSAATLRPVMVVMDRTQTFQDQVEGLLTWAKQWQPGNRVVAFDEYNQSMSDHGH